jgi:hypothetical protein
VLAAVLGKPCAGQHALGAQPAYELILGFARCRGRADGPLECLTAAVRRLPLTRTADWEATPEVRVKLSFRVGAFAGPASAALDNPEPELLLEGETCGLRSRTVVVRVGDLAVLADQPDDQVDMIVAARRQAVTDCCPSAAVLDRVAIQPHLLHEPLADLQPGLV